MQLKIAKIVKKSMVTTLKSFFLFSELYRLKPTFLIFEKKRASSISFSENGHSQNVLFSIIENRMPVFFQKLKKLEFLW
jgi:hypothetical protein